MKILIVDDEQLARQRLKDMILEFDSSHLILEANNGLTALTLVEKDSPDVILLDIRMPVMDGLETALHLTHIEKAPAIIFTTAYQDHAIEAFEVHAVDYLLKPIRRERLEAALQRSQIINRAAITALRDNPDRPSSRSHLSTTNYGKIELIPVAEIRYLKAEQKYVVVGWSGKESLLDESLKSLETEYPDRFLRIHRNALIAPKSIVSLEKDKDGSFFLHLKDVENGLPVSRRHLHKVRHTLKHLGLS